jgi:hypothetical protein
VGVARLVNNIGLRANNPMRAPVIAIATSTPAPIVTLRRLGGFHFDGRARRTGSNRRVALSACLTG